MAPSDHIAQQPRNFRPLDYPEQPSCGIIRRTWNVTMKLRCSGILPLVLFGMAVSVFALPPQLSSEHGGGARQRTPRPSRRMDAPVKADRLEAYLQQGIPFRAELDLPAGQYRLRLAVRDSDIGFLGTTEIPLYLASR